MHGIAPEHCGAKSLSIACDANVKGCVENAFQFQGQVFSPSFRRESCRGTQPLGLHVAANLLPNFEIIDDDEIPWLREANGTSLMRGRQNPRQRFRSNRIRSE
jgi:hypothetical protein